MIPSRLNEASATAWGDGNFFLLPQKPENRPGFAFISPQGDSLFA
jgi:hypothetical protein